MNDGDTHKDEKVLVSRIVPGTITGPAFKTVPNKGSTHLPMGRPNI